MKMPIHKLRTADRGRVKYTILYCIITAVWMLLVASLFVECTLYEQTDIEVIRCPEICDTVLIPGWEQHDTVIQH